MGTDAFSPQRAESFCHFLHGCPTLRFSKGGHSGPFHPTDAPRSTPRRHPAAWSVEPLASSASRSAGRAHRRLLRPARHLHSPPADRQRLLLSLPPLPRPLPPTRHPAPLHPPLHSAHRRQGASFKPLSASGPTFAISSTPRNAISISRPWLEHYNFHRPA
jgi:hypothetical protein